MEITEETRGRGRPRKYSSPEEMEQVINQYFRSCEEKGEPKTIYGLALSLDMTYESLTNYGERDEYSALVKKAKDEIIKEVELRGHSGKGNPAFGIFWLKNVAKWQDKRELEANVNVAVVDLLSALDTDDAVKES